MLAEAAARRSLPVEPAIESNSFEFLRNVVLREDALTFQIAVGAPPPEGDADGLVSRPIDIRDVPPGRLAIGQLRGRPLTVAAAKFAQRLVQRLESAAPAAAR